MHMIEPLDRRLLRDLVVAVAYADHWLKDTEVFERACKELGLVYKPGRGLYEMVETKVANPYEVP